MTDNATGEVSISHQLAQTMDVFLGLIEDGVRECNQIAQEMKTSPATFFRIAKRAMDAGKIIKVNREYFLAEGEKCRKNHKSSFHARFTKSRLVSHFMAIAVKHETRGQFNAVSPMRDPSKTMKREGHSFHALISRKTALVSGRFTFRFTLHAQLRL